MAPLDGMFEVGLNDGAFVGGASHFRLEELDPVRAGALGAIHRALALAKQILGTFLRAVIHGNADAAGNHEIAPAHLHGRAERPSDPLCKHGDMPGLRILGNQDRELQGAHACERILRRDMAGQPPRDGQKHAVIGGKIRRARLIFEGVEIDEKDRRLYVLVFCAGKRGLKPIEEQLPVGQARQARRGSRYARSRSCARFCAVTLRRSPTPRRARVVRCCVTVARSSYQR